MQRVTSAKGGSECTGYKEVSEEKNKFFPLVEQGKCHLEDVGAWEEGCAYLHVDEGSF